MIGISVRGHYLIIRTVMEAAKDMTYRLVRASQLEATTVDSSICTQTYIRHCSAHARQAGQDSSVTMLSVWGGTLLSFLP